MGYLDGLGRPGPPGGRPLLDPDPLSWFFPVALLSLSLLLSLFLCGPWVAGQTEAC